MTAFDFTTQPNRLAQHSVKWHDSEHDPELLQLWVADMDFVPFAGIRNALMQYAAEHVYGYSYPSDAYYQAIIDWEQTAPAAGASDSIRPAFSPAGCHRPARKPHLRFHRDH